MAQPRAKGQSQVPSPATAPEVTITGMEDHGYRVESLAREIYLGMLSAGQNTSRTCEFLAAVAFEQSAVFWEFAELRRESHGNPHPGQPERGS